MTDDSYLVQISLSDQWGVMKASEKEVAAANYIPESKKGKFWLHIDDENKLCTPRSLTFRRTTMSVSLLLRYLKEGFCVTSLFQRKEPFKWVGSFKGKWLGAQLIFLDADDCEIAMQQTIDSVMYKPTFAMTSQSHMMPGKKNRFRLVYAFDKVINDRDEYCMIANTLMDDVESAIDRNGHKSFKLDRSCTTSQGHFFLGNPKSNVESWSSWTIYHPSDIISSNNSQSDSTNVRKTENSGQGHKKRTKKEIQSSICPTIPRPKAYSNEEIAKLMIEDCLSSKLSIQEIIQKYGKYYKLTFETPLQKLPADKSYIPYQEGYLRIFFRPKWKTDKSGKKRLVIQPFRNGEKRHLMLHHQLIIINQIKHSHISFDELLFHALALFNWGYENKNLDGTDCVGDDLYTPLRIHAIAEKAWHANPEYWKESIDKMKEKCRYSFKTNPAGAAAEGKTLRQFSSKARKDYTRDKWNKRLSLIKTEIKAGMSHSKLAKILSDKIGEPVNPSTLGRHVREMRKNEAREQLKASKKASKNGKNDVNTNNTTNSISFSPNPPTTPIPPYTLIKEKNILLECDDMAPLNKGKQDGYSSRFDCFCRWYDENLTMAQNMQKLKKKGLDISESTYHRYKKKRDSMKRVA